MKPATVWCALGWLLAPIHLSAGEVTLIHGASVTGPLPPTDVVVLRGAEVGGAVPVHVSAPEEPRVERRVAPEAPTATIYITLNEAYYHDDRLHRSHAFKRKRHHGRSSRRHSHSSAKSRLRWDR